MRIHLIRHGQTEMNAIQTIDTVYPGASLTAKGREQAQALVGRLEGIPFDSIYVSNLVRTHQTADPLARSRSITPIERDGFREVEAGGAHYGVVPVENSSEGIVNHTLDCFKSSTLNVIGEVELRIHHQFLVSENTRKDSIKQIYAHQQTLAQCRKWLDAHYPGVERVALNSNTGYARKSP